MSDLIRFVAPDDAPDDALAGSQLWELKQGVRAAIENGETTLGAPGDLTSSEWDHAGVGVSVYMHRSGVVVIENSNDGALVTDANTLDHMSTAIAKFNVNPGPATVATEEVDR
jgi:hypothetical protein